MIQRPPLVRRPERISEYFDFAADPEKGDRKVRRVELLAILEQMERARRSTWWRRLWRWLRAPRGSGPVTAIPLTKGEIARGEGRQEPGA